MYKWYVLRVISGKEAKVKRAIRERCEEFGLVDVINDIVVPTEKIAEISSGKHKVSEKRLWPGYMLMNMSLNDEAISHIINTDGVIGFVGGRIPVPLTEDEEKDVFEDINKRKGKVVQKHKFAVGDHLKIIDGVFLHIFVICSHMCLLYSLLNTQKFLIIIILIN